MPNTTIPGNDPLSRKYTQEVCRRNGNPTPYDQFCQRLRRASDFDFTSLFLPPAPTPRLATPVVAGPKFPLGQVCNTPGAVALIPPDKLCAAIRRHVTGDWGTLDAHDLAENERALRHGGRLFSAYVASNGQKFYIITEWDRTVTTLLLPDEY